MTAQLFRWAWNEQPPMVKLAAAVAEMSVHGRVYGGLP